MASIQLLFSDSSNRRALAMLVSEHHTVIIDPDPQHADLYVVDELSLPKYQEWLEEHKREEAPVFCPVVLIRREQTPVSIELPEPDPGERPWLINEILDAPVEKHTLFRRITSLHVRREQTKDLKRKNDQLEQFSNTLQHELRNPLNVLDGYLDIAREENDSQALERCRKSTDQMKRLLEDTLLILQGEETKIDLVPVDLLTVCTDCWDMTPESNSKLMIATSRQIEADEDRLAQLLGNLFRNSVEHSTGDGKITVGDLDDGFYVEDDGPGIPEEERVAVFEEGYSNSGSGSGLGLAVVHAVADSHGWDISLTEGTEGGARFELVGV